LQCHALKDEPEQQTNAMIFNLKLSTGRA